MPGGMFINAGPLFSLAKKAYERTRAVSSDRESGQVDALVAIVFSAAALEAFVNESVELAELGAVSSGYSEPESVTNFRRLLREVEESRGSTQLKFLLAKQALTGHTYDKGAPPYQDFDLLIELRNALVHLKPRERFEMNIDGKMFVTLPKIIQRLESKNILAEFEPDENASWTQWISTRAVARWACNTAAQMVQSTLDCVPDSHLKQGMEMFYRRALTPIS